MCLLLTHRLELQHKRERDEESGREGLDSAPGKRIAFLMYCDKRERTTPQVPIIKISSHLTPLQCIGLDGGLPISPMSRALRRVLRSFAARCHDKIRFQELEKCEMKLKRLSFLRCNSIIHARSKMVAYQVESLKLYESVYVRVQWCC